MIIPLPLIFGKEWTNSKARDADGELTIGSNSKDVNFKTTGGKVRAHYTTEEETYDLEIQHKGGEHYEGVWERNGKSTALPESVACQAFEAVRQLAGKRLNPEQVTDMVDLVTAPTVTPITAERCKER
jgi:hypothetical protein